jgi:hypothetical protein
MELNSKQKELAAQIKIVKRQSEQLRDMNKRVWGDFRERLLGEVAEDKRDDAAAFWGVY